MPSGASKASFPTSHQTPAWDPFPTGASVLTSTTSLPLAPRAPFPSVPPRAQLYSESRLLLGQSPPVPSPHGASPHTGKSHSADHSQEWVSASRGRAGGPGRGGEVVWLGAEVTGTPEMSPAPLLPAEWLGKRLLLSA